MVYFMNEKAGDLPNTRYILSVEGGGGGWAGLGSLAAT